MSNSRIDTVPSKLRKAKNGFTLTDVYLIQVTYCFIQVMLNTQTLTKVGRSKPLLVITSGFNRL